MERYSEEEYKAMVLESAHDVLDRCEIYGERSDRLGLEKDIDMSIRAKAGLMEIFKNHPAYNGRGQIVLPMEVERPIDEDAIEEFAGYVEYLAREYILVEATINGQTYDDLYKSKQTLSRYVAAVDHMRVMDEEVILKGKPFTQWREEYNNIVESINRIDLTYPYTNGKYVTPECYEIYKNLLTLASVIRNTVGKALENEDNIDKLIKAFPQCQARNGIKITRCVQKCLKQCGLYDKAMEKEKERFNKAYSKWADAVSPLKVKKWSILSINFVDFLTMSHGDSWTSCLNTDKNLHIISKGCYSDGFNSRRTLDYALDPSTMVFYTIDSNYNGDTPELEPKCTRQLFHFGEGKLIQGRLYPQSNTSRRNIYTQYREVVEKVLADAMGEANLWSAPERGVIDYDGNVMNTPYSYSNRGDYIDFASNACHGGEERDFQSEVNYVVFRGSTNQEDNGRPMIVGSTDAVCIMCGEDMDEDYHECIACYSCY